MKFFKDKRVCQKNSHAWVTFLAPMLYGAQNRTPFKLKIMKNQLLYALFFLLAISACKKDTPDTSMELSFDQVIDQGGGFSDPIINEEIVSETTYEEESDTAVWVCTSQTLSIEDAAGGSSGFPLFSPNASVIYPGNMLQGQSLDDATPDIIAVDRAGGVISTDVNDGNIQSSFEVAEISKSTVTDAINNIINTSTGIVPANFSFQYHNVQSREQFALEAGVNVNSRFYELEANLSFSSDQEYNRYFAKLDQSFYTMSFDIPTSLEDLFAPNVTPEDLAKYVGPDNPATYISDVTYGRIFYMLIESTSSNTEMSAAIAGAFNNITSTVEGSLEVDYLQNLQNLKIQVYAFGGEATSSLLTIGETNLSQLVSLLAESSQIETGKPISYVVRSVYDNQIVSTQLATQYEVTNCTLGGPDGAPPYTEHWAGKVVSAFGPVGAAYNTYGTEFILINKDGDQFMRSNTGSLEGPFHIDDLGSEPCPLGKISAAVNIDGNQYGEFYLMAFDEFGTSYNYMGSSGNWLDNEPITNLDGGTCPFNLNGIGGMAFQWKDEFGPSSRMMFNRDGDSYTVYTNNPENFAGPYPITTLLGTDPAFDEIGAAIGFYIGVDRFEILFNKLGTKYIVRGNVDGSGSIKRIGPFDL